MLFVAPLIVDQDKLSDEDCHWYVIPPRAVVPVVLIVVAPVAQKDEVMALAVPAVGVPAQGAGAITVNNAGLE